MPRKTTALTSQKAKPLTPREERFCQIVGARLEMPGPAMLTVGYSRGTVEGHGPSYLLHRPEIQKRIREVQEMVAGQAVGTLQDLFLMVSKDLELAFRVERELMENSESETVRERAARTIIETGKSLVVASMPGRADFNAALRELWERAQQRVKRGESVDIPVVAAVKERKGARSH